MAKKITIPAIAERFGVTTAAVRNWMRKHADFPKVLSWPALEKWHTKIERRSRIQPKGSRKPKAAPDPTQAVTPEPTAERISTTLADLEQQIRETTSVATADILGIKSRALRALQDVMVQQKDLLPKSDVERGWIERVHAVRNGLLALPKQIAAGLVGMGAEEIETVLMGEMTKLCGEYARRAGITEDQRT